jgi:hypothetical protein
MDFVVSSSGGVIWSYQNSTFIGKRHIDMFGQESPPRLNNSFLYELYKANRNQGEFNGLLCNAGLRGKSQSPKASQAGVLLRQIGRLQSVRFCLVGATDREG